MRWLKKNKTVVVVIGIAILLWLFFKDKVTAVPVVSDKSDMNYIDSGVPIINNPTPQQQLEANAVIAKPLSILEKLTEQMNQINEMMKVVKPIEIK